MELDELMAAVKSRFSGQSQIDWKAVEAFIEENSSYPENVVKEAVKQAAKRGWDAARRCFDSFDEIYSGSDY